MSSSNRYINNDELRAELAKYKKVYTKWVADGNKPPAPMTEFDKLGRMFMKIASHFVTRRDWSNSVIDRDELISSIVADMVAYCHNIDPEDMTRSPFAYLSRIAHTSCIRTYNTKMRFDEKVNRAYEANMDQLALEIASSGIPCADPAEFVRNMCYDESADDRDDS